MRNKTSPIIILVIFLVIVALGIFAFTSFGSKENKNEGNKHGNIEENIIKPTLELSLSSSEENLESVTISAKASMEDGTTITTIILPDKSEILSSEAKYEVTKNGEYSFKAIAENGAEETVSIKVSNIKIASSTNPYIPNGFKPVKDTDIESGFVIEDTYGNQYVWVPVEKGQLKRDTMLDANFEESTNTASALVNSVAQNYGFYIGRYEASEFELNGEKVAATMSGKIPWTNLTYLEASEYATDSGVKFGYEDVSTAIINSYAWDTVLNLFDQKISNFSSSVNYGNYSGTIYPTGATQTDIIYNICDIAGNVSEWTTEIYKSVYTNEKDKNNKNQVLYRVIRGGSANLSRTPKGHRGYPVDTSEAYWGFRMVLYK